MMANASIAIHEKAEIAPDPVAGEIPTLDSLPDPPAHHEVSDEERAKEQAEKETIRDENVKAEQEQKERQTEGG